MLEAEVRSDPRAPKSSIWWCFRIESNGCWGSTFGEIPIKNNQCANEGRIAGSARENRDCKVFNHICTLLISYSNMAMENSAFWFDDSRLVWGFPS